MGITINPAKKAPAKTTGWPQTDKAATPPQKTPFRRSGEAAVNQDHGSRTDNVDNSFDPRSNR